MPRRGYWLLLAAFPLVGCIEDRLTVEIETRIHADGSCTRRIQYRLERVDRDKAREQRAEIRPENDPLRYHRFPAGGLWTMREQNEVGLRVVEVEALLPSASDADGDYYRRPTKRAQPARSFISANVEPERGVYEFQEVLRDPASPLAAARLLSRTALKREEAFARSLKLALGADAPRDVDARRAWREGLAEPFARDVAALAERPLFGPRERGALDDIYEGLEDRQQALAASLGQLAPGVSQEAMDKAVADAVNQVGEGLVEEVERAGLPVILFDDRLAITFRATLVMPAPIVRANACFSGDTVVWEFDEHDLYGRGFEMQAHAVAP
jgi:hypothetical protein